MFGVGADNSITGSLFNGLFGAISGMGQQYTSAQATNAGIEQQNRIAQYNAQVAQINQVQNDRMRAIDLERLRRQQEKQLGATQAAFAASGFTMQGTPVAVLNEDIQSALWDQELMKYQYYTKQQQFNQD